jgi:hypothetical protein
MGPSISIHVDSGGGYHDPVHLSGIVLDLNFDAPGSLSIVSGDVASVVNAASGVSWAEVTARPDYDATGLNGHGCATGTGTQKFISSEAAVVAVLTNAPAFTVFYVVQYAVADAQGVVFGVGNSGVANNQQRTLGQTTNGAGRQRDISINDAATNVTVNATIDNASTNPAVIEWFSPGTTTSCRVDGAAANPNAVAHNPGTLTPNQAAIFCRPDSVPDTFLSGKIGRVLAYNRELDATERSAVRVALGAQFGITVTP